MDKNGWYVCYQTCSILRHYTLTFCGSFLHPNRNKMRSELLIALLQSLARPPTVLGRILPFLYSMTVWLLQVPWPFNNMILPTLGFPLSCSAYSAWRTSHWCNASFSAAITGMFAVYHNSKQLSACTPYHWLIYCSSADDIFDLAVRWRSRCLFVLADVDADTLLNREPGWLPYELGWRFDTISWCVRSRWGHFGSCTDFPLAYYTTTSCLRSSTQHFVGSGKHLTSLSLITDSKMYP